MTQIEKIKAEVERRYKLLQIGAHGAFRNGKIEALREVCDFINTLQAEPVSEDLEQASERYACKFSSSKYGHDKVKDAVVWGANWQKEQMMKVAVTGNICGTDELDSGIDFAGLEDEEKKYNQILSQFNIGNKVKLIIIKED